MLTIWGLLYTLICEEYVIFELLSSYKNLGDKKSDKSRVARFNDK